MYVYKLEPNLENLKKGIKKKERERKKLVHVKIVCHAFKVIYSSSNEASETSRLFIGSFSQTWVLPR